MSQKLYVGNLSFATTEERLRTLFAQYGAVESAVIITDRATGQSKGFGFVELADSRAAAQAIAALHGREVDGRKLRVSEAQERRQPAPPRGDRRY